MKDTPRPDKTVIRGEVEAPSGGEEIALSAIEELLIEAYRWVGTISEGIWPGWRAAETPLAVYQPNKRVLLVDHPDPPDGVPR